MPNIREARLIVPTHFNHGVAISPSHINAFKHDLIKAFGGYTLQKGFGADDPTAVLRNTIDDLPQEEILIFDIACEVGNWKNWATLYYFAEWVLHDFGQESVYVRWPDGRVQFISRDTQDHELPDQVFGKDLTPPRLATHGERIRARELANTPWSEDQA